MSAHGDSAGRESQTKEQLRGFSIVEERDLNEAILPASKHTAAHPGEHVGWSIEVRHIERFEQP